MLYVIYCRDNPSTPTLRDEFYDAHRAYLKSASIKILVAGPYTSTDSEKKIGSMLVVEAESLEQATNFQKNDPFALNNVWSEVSINPYIKAIDQR
ncbi:MULTISPECIES: YciI family protein [unclassified Pseudomonas]|uniref:YciI family protein n=1 Tax=unclassified Pseudomonas TaxID=196821 RepID=UPI001783C177|nr:MULTISPECIES: YciI family protein [unclassified Pseudomonas]MBD8604568.1 YciI family protein [Pseudomonas sp. CFBP 8771]MBD8623014.1 YciI family protein [Pseudomonas sp. CFBP 13727]MBD8732954.1 YciI family protein [Pseudomonas sp. CFBP 13710]MBD8825764.1 YciI family protein [Pseudomonas sp. CFBP 13602]